MFAQMWRTFRAIFTTRASRLSVSGLLFAMAMIPVVEILVIRMFSSLIIDGPAQYEDDPNKVIEKAIWFFVAFAGSRGLHHLLRFWRVRVFREGFKASASRRSASQESWEWALAFELSNVVVSLIQTLAFSALFIAISWEVGVFNAVVCAMVFWLISRIYGRQLTRQVGYIEAGNKAGSVSIGERVGSRIRDAEFGSVLSSIGMALTLAAVLVQTVRHGLGSSDAIVLFLGLRLLYGQVGHLSGGVMRFARALARRNTPPPQRAPKSTARGAIPSKHRGRLLEQSLAAGQSGDIQLVDELSERLRSLGPLSDREESSVHAARTFATYAAGTPERSTDPTLLKWMGRPFPGNVGDWLSPYILGHFTSGPVIYVPPRFELSPPHLALIGSLGRFVSPTSIVAGIGVSSADTEVNPDAVYLSLRGPETAQLLRAQGGPAVDRLGDPTLLISRALPRTRGETNGRLAFIRSLNHRDTPIVVPDALSELNLHASSPAQITELVTNLMEHDGVVTSALPIAAICHAYGIPCALVTFQGHEEAAYGSGLIYRDYSLGAGLDQIWEPQAVPADLTAVNWDDLLSTELVGDEKLDEIESAARDAIDAYQVLSEDFADEDIEAEA